MKKFKKAFTLIEIIIASAVFAVVLTAIFSFYNFFMKSYSSGESTAILLQDSALFFATLRNDLNNAVIENITEKINPNEIIISDETQIIIPAYNNTSGKVETVIYELVKQKNENIIVRKTYNNLPKKIIGNVASISWQVECDNYNARPKNINRICVSVSLSCNMKKKTNNNEFKLKTNIFPARLNKQIN